MEAQISKGWARTVYGGYLQSPERWASEREGDFSGRIPQTQRDRLSGSTLQWEERINFSMGPLVPEPLWCSTSAPKGAGCPKEGEELRSGRGQ
jgi:hypothetical protein